jgi:hypothetical protein
MELLVHFPHSFLSIYIFLYRFAKKIEYFRFSPCTLSALIMFVGVMAMKIFDVQVIINIIVSAGIYITSLFLLKETAIFEVLGLFKK